MREFELIIDEAFKNGLSPELMTPLNTQVLLEALGFRCGKLGLEPYAELSNPLPAAIDLHYNWPFPQYLIGELYNILVVRDMVNIEDVVYSVSDDHDTVTQIAVADQLTYGSLGTLMELADFGEFAVIVNGVVIVSWDPLGPGWQTTTATAIMPLMRTICNFNGQAVGGNVVSAWHDCDSTFYIWSKIGSIDFTFEEFNTAGFRRCPYGGEVYHTRKLGDTVIGYSSKGITRLSPVSQPAVTFGFKELDNVGLVNRDALAGDDSRHVYVGEDLVVREVTSQGVNELGFQHLMQALGSAEDIIVTFEPSENNFYIGNSGKTYLLSPFGMTEIMQHPSAIWRRNKYSYILPEIIDSDDPLIVTEAFDMGYAGQKTIAVIESDAAQADNPEASLDYGSNVNDFVTMPFTPINNQGVATITASGEVFRFRLKFDLLSNTFRIKRMTVRYKMTDLRSIRGVYAPPPRGQ